MALATLAAAPLPAEPLPKSFRLLKFGPNLNWNDEAAGTPPITLTREGAKRIMAEAAKRPNVEFLLDLEHRSLSADAKAKSDSASNAQAWFKLAIKSDGLYAVDVRYTPEGESRLRSRSQRFISPVVLRSADGIVTDFVNAGLVSEPALFDAPALVAASRQRLTARESDTLTARLPVAAKAALIVAARQRRSSVGAVVREMLLAAAKRGYPSGGVPQPIGIADLLDLLGLPQDMTDPTEIHAAVDDLLKSAKAPKDAPARAPAPKTPPPAAPDVPRATDPVANAKLQASLANLDAVQRDRLDRMRAANARNRRPRGK